jgi:hypothetical protein
VTQLYSASLPFHMLFLPIEFRLPYDGLALVSCPVSVSIRLYIAPNEFREAANVAGTPYMVSIFRSFFLLRIHVSTFMGIKQVLKLLCVGSCYAFDVFS